MSLISSISGIRGTIGGKPGENLTPLDIVKFSAAFGVFIKKNNPDQPVKIIVGRDARVSGEMVRNLVVGALLSQGIKVIDLGLATTPTVEMAVIQQKAQGGVILSASHNPQGYNALKLINAQGEFLSQVDGEELLRLLDLADFNFVSEENLGRYVPNPFLAADHLDAILEIPLVDKKAISSANFKVVVDGINSVGGIIVPELLEMLGVKNIIKINCEPNGQFAHKPEPLAENLTVICDKVREFKADLGIVVDPDVDRLAFINEQGEMISEEYTLVMVADYVLQNFPIINNLYPGKYSNNTVSNLSSSRALKDITGKYQGTYEAAPVGEINVVEKMKEVRAAIGGEGNGGVIYAPLHYGRDALVGIALFLTALAKSGQPISVFQKQFPEYFMVKDHLDLTPGLKISALLNKIAADYAGEKLTTIDGVKIDWPDSWVHLRASNTEPIIRIYAEAPTRERAAARVKEVKDKILANIK
jgi:phosphomannomutase